MNLFFQNVPYMKQVYDELETVVIHKSSAMGITEYPCIYVQAGWRKYLYPRTWI